jgi:hypothetical protein
MSVLVATGSASELIETDIPARLERLPWGRFHTLVVVALGITWILDGLEVTRLPRYPASKAGERCPPEFRSLQKNY